MTTIATPDADSVARQDLLERYARLAIRVGINLEPGREVAIRAMIEHAPLVRALVRPAYEAGARQVEVDYEDPEVMRSQIALAPDEAVGTAPRWRFERLDDVREQRRAQVAVIGFSPDSYLRDVLPGMLVAGLGLGVAVVSVSISILTGAREEETGMISGLNSTGHEIGGTIGIAIFSTIAAGTGILAGPRATAGISHAFIAAALLASVASVVALAVLPGARHFVPRLRLNPKAMPIH